MDGTFRKVRPDEEVYNLQKTTVIIGRELLFWTALIPNAASLVSQMVIGGIRFRLGLLSELILSKEEHL